MIDHSRHFRNEAREDLSNDWSVERCSEYAQKVTKECLEGSHVDRSSLGSLYHGLLGPSVYLRLRLAQYRRIVHDDAPTERKLLFEAHRLVEEAVARETMQLQRSSSVRVTLLEGPFVGAKAMEVAVLFALGDTSRARDHASDLLAFLSDQSTQLPVGECELLYGRAGALQTVLFLRRELRDQAFGSKEAVQISQDIVTQGLQPPGSNLPMIWKWHANTYLGAAHGVVGILQMLLSLTISERQQIHVTRPLDELIKDTIGALDSYCWPESGNLRTSVESSSSKDRLVHWCHGAPGHILLLLKAYQVYNEPVYLQKASHLATNVIWPRGLLRKGVGLCHGISGNAYCLLELAQFSERDLWTKRALHFCSFAMEHFDMLKNVPDHPHSIFEGSAGLALLLLDLGMILHNPHSDHASFPLYSF